MTHEKQPAPRHSPVSPEVLGGAVTHIVGVENRAITVDGSSITGNLAPHSYESEAAELSALLAGSEAVGEEHEIIPVGNAGFLIRLGEQPVTPNGDWILFDLDDTLVAYSESKKARLEAYVRYARDIGLDLDIETGESMLEMTDRFARWEEAGEETYHIRAHRAALAWATAELQTASSHDAVQKIGRVKIQLDAVKGGQADPLVPTDHIPFHFSNNHLVLNPDAQLPDIDSVFHPMVQPSGYDDALSAIVELGEAGGHNQAIFTYGEPPFQLEKVIGVLERQASMGRLLPIAQILLTRVPKGIFLDHLLELASLDYKVKGDFFGVEPHSLLLVDDTVEQLNSYLSKGEAVEAVSGASLLAMRTIRRHTKTERQQWEEVPGSDPYRSTYRVNDDGFPYHGSLADTIRGVLGARKTARTV